jgi:hypothetical protein
MGLGFTQSPLLSGPLTTSVTQACESLKKYLAKNLIAAIVEEKDGCRCRRLEHIWTHYAIIFIHPPIIASSLPTHTSSLSLTTIQTTKVPIPRDLVVTF